MTEFDPYEPPEQDVTPPPRAAPVRPHNGVLVLVFGGLGLLGTVGCFLGFPFGVAAWILAHRSLREVRSGRMDPAGRGLLIAGMILGILTCVLAVLMVAAWFALATTVPNPR